MADAKDIDAKHKRQQIRVSFTGTPKEAWPPEEETPRCMRGDIVPGKQRLMSIGPREKPGAYKPRIPIPELARRHTAKLGNMRKTGVYG